jgi:isopropylmalate/homocitrate/citramalate synthase
MREIDSKTPWKTDKWYTSPWNFEPETRKHITFSRNIKFHDVTLRDGEQQAGLIFNKEQKVALAEKLAELGVQRIEAGMPAVSPQDEAAIREIVKRDFGPEIWSFARCMKDDVKRSVDCGVKNVVLEVPTSGHLLQYAYKWTQEKAIETSIEATRFAHENGLTVSFFTIDGSRADIDEYLRIVKTVAREGHMDELTIVDTFGGLNPHAIPFLVKSVREAVPDVPLGIHVHDDYGMGSAITVAALAAGVDIAHTSISACGERAGNAAYEDVAMALLTLYGVDTGLKYEKIYPLAEYFREMSGLRCRQSRGIIGEDIHKIESGIVAAWYKNVEGIAPLELSPYLYSLTGHPDTEVVIGKMSGIPTVDIYLDKLGLKAKDEDQKLEIVKKMKEKAFEKMSLLSVGEFEEIARRVLGG